MGFPVKRTISMCPVCYRDVTATVHIEDVVRIKKFCPVHGESQGVLEVDPNFYVWCMTHPAPIYDGHLVDVTDRCNLNCKYCFHSRGNTDIKTSEIVNECAVNKGPYFLTGGEPTLRKDLPDIIRRCSEIGPTYFLTNGHGLLNKEYLLACNESIFKYNGFSGIGLSYHKEFQRFDEVISNLIETGVRPHTIFFVIDSLDELTMIKEFSEKHRGLFEMVRIKCASNLWNEENAKPLYISQILDWFHKQGKTTIGAGGKTSYFPFLHNGILYGAVNWFDVTNVDCVDISCPPTYRAETGEVTDFVKACLINEGVSKGWLNGQGS